jgi:hypothetical protein
MCFGGACAARTANNSKNSYGFCVPPLVYVCVHGIQGQQFELTLPCLLISAVHARGVIKIPYAFNPASKGKK